MTTFDLILEAAKTNDVTTLESLMAPEDYIEYAHDIMIEACKNGSLDIINLLLENEDVYIPELSVYLDDVIKYKHYHILDYLLSNGADPDYMEGELLNDAIDLKSIEAMTILFKYKAIPHETLFHALFKTENNDLIQLFLDHCNTPYLLNEGLERACSHNNTHWVDYFLKKGADIHYRNEAPLFSAINNHYLSVIELLIEKGAIIDTQSRINNPIIKVISDGKQRILDYFIESGFDIKKEATRLFPYATYSNSPSFIQDFHQKYQPDIFADEGKALQFSLGSNSTYALDYLLPLYYEYSPTLIEELLNNDMKDCYPLDLSAGIRYVKKFLTEKLVQQLENVLPTNNDKPKSKI